MSVRGDHVLCQRVRSDTPVGDAGFKHWVNVDMADIPPSNTHEEDDAIRAAEVRSEIEYIVSNSDLSKWDSDSHSPDLGLDYNDLDRTGVVYYVDELCSLMYNNNLQPVGARFRTSAGKKYSLMGGREGLFLYPPEIEWGNEEVKKTLVVVEGLTDFWCLSADLDAYFEPEDRPEAFELCPVGLPSAGGGFSIVRDIVQKYNVKKVFMIPDQDETGLACAKRMQAMLSYDCKITSSLDLPKGYKDFRDFYMQGGRFADL